MSNSKYEYVKLFESSDVLLPQCWVVIRIDGRYFTRFTSDHNYAKPNDRRGIDLMNRCAKQVLLEFPGDLIMAYGQSDEYSFVMRKTSNLFNRRASKLQSNIVSLFSSSFVFHWSAYFSSPQEQKLLYPPSFDSRTICYPNDRTLRDYLAWRQVDCHINNLYNTCFWSLVNLAGESNPKAEQLLRVRRIRPRKRHNREASNQEEIKNRKKKIYIS